MQARKHRHILDGANLTHLFPSANLTEKTVKRGATVADTVQFIPEVVAKTRWQTEKIARHLQCNNTRSTCRAIWDFVYHHIAYHKDEDGTEQVRSPARAWHDRFRGVDCDCYTVLISTILTNLDIPHKLRITKYREDRFQHIYPIVPTKTGTYITIDCVVDAFDYEEPYTQKQDTIMDLQYLDGLDGDLQGEDLGRRKKKDRKKGGFFRKIGGALKKGLHAINRINPATLLLRNGILAAMKLNMFKIAQRIKWAYLSEADAKKRGIDIGKWKRLVQVREKLEKIHYGAGGKPENLKKAILSGKGNRNKEVSGLFGVLADVGAMNMTEQTPLQELLGEEIWRSENMEGMEGFEGFGELGEPVTGASIAAATGVLAAIAGLLKSIGNIFPKKQQGTEDFENTALVDATAIAQAQNLPAPSASLPQTLPSTTTSVDTALTIPEDGSDEDKPEGFWEKNKKWLKPTLIGVGGLGLLYLGYRMVKGGQSQKGTNGLEGQPLAGVKSRKKKATPKKKAAKPKRTAKPRKKKPVSLM